MDGSINVSELTQILQCAVCLETVCNPKMLRCNHSYCKRCLDKLLTFSQGGSAAIKCPKGCAKSTRLSFTHTTEDLGVDYMLKGILEKVEAKDIPQEDDDESEKVTCEMCAKCATRYCAVCKLFKCVTCPDRHDPAQMFTGEGFIPVKFDKHDKRLVIMCEEHATEATYMCCNTKFVCVYCVNRTHVGHQYESLESSETKLKEILSGEIESSERLSVGWNETKEDIASAESNLDEMLKIKKLRCVQDYVAFLNEEEETVKNDFNFLRNDHTKPFTSLESTGYFKECLSMKGSDLLLRKTDLMNKIKSKNKMTREVTLSLTESTFDETHPLGCLNIIYGKRIAIDKLDRYKKTFKSNITPDAVAPPSLNSLRNLKDMLESACGEYNDETDSEESNEETISIASTSSVTTPVTTPKKGSPGTTPERTPSPTPETPKGTPGTPEGTPGTSSSESKKNTSTPKRRSTSTRIRLIEESATSCDEVGSRKRMKKR